MFGFRKNKTSKDVARIPANKNQRNYIAAQINRLTSDWAANFSSINTAVHASLKALRARSRFEAANSVYIENYLQMLETNIIGHNGLRLNMEIYEEDGRRDEKACEAIEEAWLDFCSVGQCDVTGMHYMKGLDRLIISTTAQDGEALVRVIFDKKFKYGLKLQLLDADRLDVDYNETLTTGNVIKMGVELNKFGQPVNYYLLVQNPNDEYDMLRNGKKYEVIPAGTVFHLFKHKRPEQNRGIPWTTSALDIVRNLRGYIEAAMFAARIGAAKMGFFTKNSDSEADATELSDEKDADGNFITEAEVGQMTVLPDGYDFKSFDPDYPHMMYDSFTKSCVRSMSTGLHVSYHGLGNDLENVNFSSIRSGTLTERDGYRIIQDWYIETFKVPFFKMWLEFALLKGAIKLASGTPLPAYKLEKFSKFSFKARSWEWVDPEKDISASILAIENDLDTQRHVIEEHGLDYEEVMAQRKKEREARAAFAPSPEKITKTDKKNPKSA